MICEICGGMGKQLRPVIHKPTNRMKLVAVPCVCFISDLVSQEQKLLQSFGDFYLPEAKRNKELIFKSDDIYNSPNLRIIGEENTFLLNVKSLLIENRFNTPKAQILFARAIEIFHEFHVPQKDGTEPEHLSAVGKYDLLIMILGTREKNQALAQAMLQIMDVRIGERRPTWIYMPTKQLSQCVQEYSPEFEEIISKFTEVEILPEECKKQVKASKNKAANFAMGK